MGKKRIGADDICRRVREKLLRGDLKPGDRIVEQDFAEEFGISRTPVREAISRLCNEGVFSNLPNIGTFVRSFSANDVESVFEIREVLESLAFRKAAEHFSDAERKELLGLGKVTDSERGAGNWDEAFRTDELFHSFIIDRCGNDLLKEELRKFSFQSTLIFADLSSVRSRVKRKNITVTHTELAESADNPEKAERLMREHIAGLKRWLFS